MPMSMNTNLFPGDLSLDLDMNMSKMNVPFNSGYGATGWGDGLSYSPDVFIEDPSFDYFSMFSTGAGNGSGNNTTAAPNDFMSWPAAQPYNAQTVSSASPTNCFGFPDLDYVSEGNIASPGELTDGSSPRASSSSSRKRAHADDSDSSAAEEPESPRQTKKSRPSPRFGKAASKASSQKSTSTTSSPPAAASETPKPSVALRTAPRKPKAETAAASGKASAASPATPDDDLTVEEQRARQSHNLVEKKYRNRLNAQFEQLLAVLPAEQQREATTKRGGAQDGEEKRMSKGDVLDMARRRIRALEQEKARLQAERQALLLEQSSAMRGLASPVLV